VISGKEVFEVTFSLGRKTFNLVGVVMAAVMFTPRRLYYSDCSRRFPHIGICDMAVETCSTVKFGAPHGCVTSLVVDVGQQRVYWSDSERAIISAADVTGHEIVPIRCKHTCSLSMKLMQILKRESHLSPTDPRDALRYAHRVVHKCGRSV